jgi:Domain of unknown function (DUF4328)
VTNDPALNPALKRGLEDGFYKPIDRVGFAAAVLIGIAAVVNAATAWSDRTDVAIAATIALIVAGLAFLMWLWQARQNAEILSRAPHRRSRVWLTLSWLIPVVNLWFPYQIVADIYRASRPDNPRDLADLRTVPGSPLLPVWWILWLVGNILAIVVAYDTDLSDDTARLLLIINALAMLGAGALLILIMRKISEWQRPRWSS